MASPEAPIAYILGTYPQPSQRFIAREVRGLLAAGAPVQVFALRRRSPEVLEDPDRAWFDTITFAPRSLMPAALAANLWWLRRHPGRYGRTLWSLLWLPHRPRILRVRALALMAIAGWIARTIQRRGGCRLVHAHFALAQTEVAMAVSALLGCPFSFTAHARDIYATPSALPEKMRAAAVVVTCTAYNVSYLQRLCPDVRPAHVRLVHHGIAGIDAPSPAAVPDDPPTILAAGRLIEKKGFDNLIAACRLLRDRGVRFRCQIAGDGPLRAALQQAIDASSLASIVLLTGWTSAEALADRLSRSVALVVPSRISPGGDRDGIPNVVLEAMAAARPVVATRVSGIPEAVQHGVTGLLVDAGDRESLANAIQQLILQPEEARRMGLAGQELARQEFDLAGSTARLLEVFATVTAGVA